MWPRRAHVVKPLIDKYVTKNFFWTDDMERASKEMKILMEMDCLIQYPNYNLGFDIYTDARDYQMGACIIQNGNIGPENWTQCK